jgi:AcrR family transcriptional regulator
MAVAPTKRLIYRVVDMVDRRTTRHAHVKPDLVEKTADWLQTNGLEAASMRNIAAGIGVSHATLLHHFGSKEGLLVEVLASFRGRQRLLLAAAAAEAGADHLGALLWATWQRVTAPDAEPFVRLVFELVGVGVRSPDRVQGFLDGVVADWTGSVRLLLERAGVPSDQAERLATFVFGAIRGLLIDQLTTGDRERVEGGVRELAEFIDDRVAAATQKGA